MKVEFIINGVRLASPTELRRGEIKKIIDILDKAYEADNTKPKTYNSTETISQKNNGEAL